jgi:S-adenosyl methyltransferase
MARVYDFWLGGKDNYAADRAVAEQVAAAYPDVRAAVRAQRAYLARAVDFLVTQAGIRQFLDIGTGLPSANNTHQVAQRAASASRVVYVDNDRFKSGCAHVEQTDQVARSGTRIAPRTRVEPAARVEVQVIVVAGRGDGDAPDRADTPCKE